MAFHRQIRSVPDVGYSYEPHEPFGEGLTTRRPWNTGALTMVELINGRVAMLGFAAALIGELVSGHGPAGQVMAMVRWYLSL
ncbi:chlorophyll a/b-binding protein [Synechococcus sp. UW105]|jgi:hypothetical protein|uniref:chlorophyll a/b-binding protein n=1 Tax=unclassified Synechococcus TaxID=2626047 RepID=UPI0014833093|nr:chlorophyll a/b-binding protein [Synechococcus sp. UW105]|tara:strand:+ start:1385 stop:1630 length:246 start_codon:yes stop_codon:yes gene_type:complete